MKVFIDEKEIVVFEGAKVKDAVLSLSKEIYKDVLSGKKIVKDRFGFETMLNGHLTDGQKLTIESAD